jgi:hypothetical protein
MRTNNYNRHHRVSTRTINDSNHNDGNMMRNSNDGNATTRTINYNSSNGLRKDNKDQHPTQPPPHLDEE